MYCDMFLYAPQGNLAYSQPAGWFKKLVFKSLSVSKWQQVLAVPLAVPEPDQWREGKTFLINGRLEPPFQSIPEALLASLGGNQSQEQDVALSPQRQLRRAPRPASETRSLALTSSPRSATRIRAQLPVCISKSPSFALSPNSPSAPSKAQGGYAASLATGDAAPSSVSEHS